MLFGKPIATLLPSHMSRRPENREYKEHLEHRQERMKENYDARAGDVKPPLYPGQDVRVRNKQTQRWEPAEVVERLEEPRSYQVRAKSNTLLRRNRVDLKEGRKAQQNTDNNAPLDKQSSPKRQPPARENINPHQSPTKAVDQPHGARATTSSDMGETTQASALPAETQRVTRSGRQVVMPARYRE
jgi:hypothetical protein